MTSNIAEALFKHWTGPDVPTQKESFLEVLQHGIWEVEFTKTNGEESLMHVTLDKAIVPPAPAPKNPLKEARPPQDHLIHAFSTDRGGWRSFVVANVKSFRKIQ